MLRAVAFSITLAAATNAARNASVAAPAGEVEVVGMDYAFKVPGELPAGRTVFRFRNAGKFRHELNVTLLKPGVTLKEFMSAVNASQPLAPLTDAPVGVLFATPGAASPSALSTELLAGRTYAVRCIFKDNKEAPRHEALGMFSAIHVTNAKSGATTTVPVDTIVATDYAFRYPRTLAPGTHRLAFANTGKQRHEVNIELLAKGVTIEQFTEADAKGENVNRFLDKSLGVLHSPAGASPVGMLEADLLPGRDYMIECGFSDTDKSPPHYKLGMFGFIRVKAR